MKAYHNQDNEYIHRPYQFLCVFVIHLFSFVRFKATTDMLSNRNFYPIFYSTEFYVKRFMQHIIF